MKLFYYLKNFRNESKEIFRLTNNLYENITILKIKKKIIIFRIKKFLR